MSTITKQWLQQKIADMEAIRDDIPFGLGEDGTNTLAALRIALASLEAEAVCVIDQSNLDYLKSGSDADVWPASRAEMGDVLLYRSATPAPVVVTDRSMFEKWWESEHGSPLDSWDSLRTPDGYCDDGIDGQFESWNACHAAMLQGADGKSPVIPDGWVIVPAEPTAEMLQSGISAHYERNQIQIHDRPAPGPMECAYVAMLAAAPQQEAE